MKKPDTSHAKLVTIESFSSDAMEVLMDSEHGHFSALIVAALQAATMAAAATQALGERLLELGVSEEEVEQIITDCDTHPMMPVIRSHMGQTCIKSAVGQWNCEIAGVLDEEPAEQEPEIPIFEVEQVATIAGDGFTMKVLKLEEKDNE